MIPAACIVAYFIIGTVIAGLLLRFDALSPLELELGAPIVVTVLWPIVAAGYVVIAAAMLVALPLRALYRWIGGAS